MAERSKAPDSIRGRSTPNLNSEYLNRGNGLRSSGVIWVRGFKSHLRQTFCERDFFFSTEKNDLI